MWHLTIFFFSFTGDKVTMAIFLNLKAKILPSKQTPLRRETSTLYLTINSPLCQYNGQQFSLLFLFFVGLSTLALLFGFVLCNPPQSN